MSETNIIYIFILVFMLLILISKLDFLRKLLKAVIVLLLYFMVADAFPSLRLPYLYEFLNYILTEIIKVIEKLTKMGGIG